MFAITTVRGRSGATKSARRLRKARSRLGSGRRGDYVSAPRRNVSDVTSCVVKATAPPPASEAVALRGRDVPAKVRFRRWTARFAELTVYDKDKPADTP